MSANKQITIVGAGIAGLVLGRGLLNQGIKPTILEKARPSPHRNNYGITLHSSSYRPLLEILGLDETAFRRRVAVDAAIGGVGRVSGDDGETAPSFRANRNRFESLLAEGLEVQWESEVDRVRGTSLLLSSGEEKESMIVVGADGPHSQVRKAVAPEAEARILPFVAYNGKRKVSREQFNEDFAGGFGGGNVAEQRGGGSIWQISINDIDNTEVSIGYTYSRLARKGHDPVYRPQRAKEAATEIPEELFQEVESLRENLPRPFRTIFDTDAMRKDRLLNWLMRSIQIDPAMLQSGAEQGVVLIGDACHGQPILGPSFGAVQAIQDSIALADFLTRQPKSPLAWFCEGRIEVWQAAVEDSESRIQDMHANS